MQSATMVAAENEGWNFLKIKSLNWQKRFSFYFFLTTLIIKICLKDKMWCPVCSFVFLYYRKNSLLGSIAMRDGKYIYIYIYINKKILLNNGKRSWRYMPRSFSKQVSNSKNVFPFSFSNWITSGLINISASLLNIDKYKCQFVNVYQAMSGTE